MTLTNTYTNQLLTDGFVIYDEPIVPNHLLAKAKIGVQEVMQGAYDTGIAPVTFATSAHQDVLQRVSKVHVANIAIRELIMQSSIGKLASEILGAKQVKLWGSQLYYKPPNKGLAGNVGWHRDSQHIDCFEGDIVVAWVALDEVLEPSGCLKYIKSSHCQGSFSNPIGGNFQHLEQESTRLMTKHPTEKWEEVNVILPAGGVSFHHWDLIHGSGANLTDTPRIGLSLGIASQNFRIKDDKWDFGFKSIINDPFYCPVIYG